MRSQETLNVAVFVCKERQREHLLSLFVPDGLLLEGVVEGLGFQPCRKKALSACSNRFYYVTSVNGG